MSLLLICVLIFGAGCYALGYVTAATRWREITPPLIYTEEDQAADAEVMRNAWSPFDEKNLPSRSIVAGMDIGRPGGDDSCLSLGEVAPDGSIKVRHTWWRNAHRIHDGSPIVPTPEEIRSLALSPIEIENRMEALRSDLERHTSRHKFWCASISEPLVDHPCDCR